MPNYSLLINSEFKPYSFDELVKPFQMYAQAYNEVDSAYNTLGTNAGALESVLNQERDKAAWGQYNAYMQGLNDAATELATKGLSPAARTQVGNLTKQYAQSIVPIQKAAETWQKQIEEQRKAGDSKINSYNANTLSIDKFLENPQLSYETIDRENLKKESAAYFSQIAKRAGDIVANKVRDPKGNYTYYMDFVQKTGATPEEVLAFQDDMVAAMKTGDMNAVYAVANAHPELGNIFNDIFKSTKAVNWDPNSEGTAQVLNTILEGSLASIGETKHDLKQDSVGADRAKAATDYYYWKKKEDYKAQQDAAKQAATAEAALRNEMADWTPDIVDLVTDFNTAKKNKFVKNNYISVVSGGNTKITNQYKKDLSELKKLCEKYGLSEKDINQLQETGYLLNPEETKKAKAGLLTATTIKSESAKNTINSKDRNRIVELANLTEEFADYIQSSTGYKINAKPFTYTQKSNSPFYPFEYEVEDWNIESLDKIEKALNQQVRNEGILLHGYRYRATDADAIGDDLVAEMSAGKKAELEKIKLVNNGDGTFSIKSSGSISRNNINTTKTEGDYIFNDYTIIDTKEGPEMVTTDNNGDYYRVPESAGKNRILQHYSKKIKPTEKALEQLADTFTEKGINIEEVESYIKRYSDTELEQLSSNKGLVELLKEYRKTKYDLIKYQKELQTREFPDKIRTNTSTPQKN